MLCLEILVHETRSMHHRFNTWWMEQVWGEPKVFWAMNDFRSKKNANEVAWSRFSWMKKWKKSLKKLNESKTNRCILIVVTKSSMKTTAKLTVRWRRCVITKTFSCVKHTYMGRVCECEGDCMPNCTKLSTEPSVCTVEYRLHWGVGLKTKEPTCQTGLVTYCVE